MGTVRSGLVHLWPRDERDEGFRQEILTLSHASLRVIGAQELIIPLVMLLIGFAVLPNADGNTGRVLELLGLVGVGAVTSAVATTNWSRRHGRQLAILSAWLVTAILVHSSGEHLMATRVFGPDHFVPGYVTIVMLVAVATIPLRPFDTFTLGLSIEAFYFFSFPGSPRSVTTPAAFQHSFVLILVSLCTVLTASIYAKRCLNYRSHQEALAASRRALLSESAASMNRFAAALSHELNSPLGALISATDVLTMLPGRRAKAAPAERQRLERLENSLLDAASDAARRLHQAVTRMQRFTNLDRAEARPADLNDLLRDVAGVLEPERRATVLFEFDLRPLAPVHCHVQQMSAAFYALLTSALNAVDVNGRIAVSSRQTDSQVEILISDDGRETTAESLTNMFDPGFQALAGRVVTGNWSLFHCRQIIREHGGDVRIQSRSPRGTRVSVTLPLSTSVGVFQDVGATSSQGQTR